MLSLRTLYKSIWYLFFIIRNNISNFYFHLLMRLNSIEFGNNVKALGGVVPILRINRFSKVSIGNNCIFNSFNDVAWYCKSCIWTRPNAILKIGNNTGLNGALIYCSSRITIGDYVMIGGGSKIFDTDFHPLFFVQRRAPSLYTVSSSPIVIGDDVFVGANCIILKGVHIGARSIVAAGSVVTKNIGEDELWGGNPAKFIKKINI